MPDRIENQRVIANGGLFSNENHLQLSEENPGAASRLVNYEVSLFGGYRRLEGFAPFDADFPEVAAGVCEGPVLGIAIYSDPITRTTYPIAARKLLSGDEYGLFKHVSGVGWQQFTLPAVRAMSEVGGYPEVNRVQYATMNFAGDGEHIVFVDGVNPALVFNGVGWYELTSAGDGSEIDPGGPNVLDAPGIVTVFQNHIFLSGDVAYPSVVAYSAPLSSQDWTAASGSGQLAVGHSVVQAKPFREDLFIFGRNSISKAVPDVEAGFTVKPVTTSIGCIARDSVVEIGGDLVFLAPDGLRPVAGTSRIGDVELETISKSVQRMLVNLTFQYDLDTVVAVVVRSKSQVRMFAGDGSIPTEDAYGIIGGLRTADQQLGWEFGEILGIRASCTTSEYVGREEWVLHGDYNGKLYRQEQGTTFDGADIIAIYETPFLDFGDTEVRKTFHYINTYLRAEGDLTLYLSLTYDWGDHEILNPVSYQEQTHGFPVFYQDLASIYGNANVLYGGPSRPMIETRVEGSGHSIKVSYVSFGDFAPYSIQGIVFEFSQAGRRQ